MPNQPQLFPVEALPENRSGHLTGDQAQRFERMVGLRRKSARSLAVPVGAIGALLLILSGPPATAVKRHLAGWGFVVAALLILAAPSFDPLLADVREGRVDTVDGAIGKRRVQSMGRMNRTRYYLIIAGKQLQTYLSAYEAAPDAGYVRAFYLRRTRRLVNLERLPNPPAPSSPGEFRDMMGRMARAFVTGDRVALAEARASGAGLIDAVQESRAATSDAPGARGGSVLEREALVGRWTNPLATVTLAENGTATVMTIAGATQTGRWSVDGQGRLLTDVTGRMEPTEAQLEGDRLIVQLEGRRLTFTRASSA
jgi:hypothetical protein